MDSKTNREENFEDMLYIIKKLSNSYYLCSYEDTNNEIKFVFSPLISDALKLLQPMAERYMCVIKEIEHDEYEIIPAK